MPWNREAGEREQKEPGPQRSAGNVSISEPCAWRKKLKEERRARFGGQEAHLDSPGRPALPVAGGAQPWTMEGPREHVTG